MKFFKKKNFSSSTATEDFYLNKQQERKLTNFSKSFDYYKAVRTSKARTELLSVTLARRLLRVKQTLVLPAHVNITVITNSYD